MTEARMFPRSFDSLPAIFTFTAELFARERIDPQLLPVIDFAIEELFTNMVKYGKGSKADIRIEMTGTAGGVEVTLTDYDVDPFDVTKSPDVDIGLPIEQREPGGLGLHLIRKLLDSIEYEYIRESRQSRITFRKRSAEGSGPATAGTRGINARD
jgi:serine/threonine-protein kinase RsbW